MSFYQLFSDEPKDKVSVLNKQKQMALDARQLTFEQWNDKYGKMDEEDTRAFFPGRVYNGKETFKEFKDTDIKWYENRINSEIKKQESARKAEELLGKEAAQKAGFLKTLIGTESAVEKIKTDAPIKYQFSLDEDLDPVNYMSAGMIKEAEDRIKNKKGIGLTGDPNNEMVCIKGVCTLAANQGVDFRSGFGGYKEGVDTDELGRLIPQFNPYFKESYEKAGFKKLAKGEKPKKGDFVQYVSDGTPTHMEMLFNSDGKTIETFNNYDLYNKVRLNPNINTEVGRSKRTIKPGGGVDDWEEAIYYRLSPEAATAALSKNAEYQTKVKGKQSFEASDEYKQLQEATKFLEENKNTNILGDDQALVGDLIKGIRSGAKKEDLLKLTEKAKNPKLLSRTIENLYQ